MKREKKESLRFEKFKILTPYIYHAFNVKDIFIYSTMFVMILLVFLNLLYNFLSDLSFNTIKTNDYLVWK